MADDIIEMSDAKPLSVQFVYLANGKSVRFGGAVKFLIQSGALIIYSGQDQNDATLAVFAPGVWISVNIDTK